VAASDATKTSNESANTTINSNTTLAGNFTAMPTTEWKFGVDINGTKANSSALLRVKRHISSTPSKSYGNHSSSTRKSHMAIADLQASTSNHSIADCCNITKPLVIVIVVVLGTVAFLVVYVFVCDGPRFGRELPKPMPKQSNDSVANNFAKEQNTLKVASNSMANPEVGSNNLKVPSQPVAKQEMSTKIWTKSI